MRKRIRWSLLSIVRLNSIKTPQYSCFHGMVTDMRLLYTNHLSVLAAMISTDVSGKFILQH
ncbi:hypothetical protein BCR41DRAFT_188150 [Lobosporangium transversale]|uniref:Uncharacterized protein n=1 Tax=Lobosporangium transversale TaxID=64571 RepID=A0A1Y2GAA0_9FUNG|nr:hypothetical protein BCR41DRAFT_188150 [Lobosporangium transversale]ORZ05332.1 hypothetical protein BCR41DRAFT_188150 [Lobosporangium transversale]|eukprot:XP_021877024.1 hypothetical protein BCR41DRAFT_188150 [Lobosporangium transversale]